MTAKHQVHLFRLGLITGATSGIGSALARELAAHEIPLILTGRSLESLNQLAAELNPQIPVEIVALDLASSKDRQQLVEMIHQQKPDLLVNNAGLGLYGDALEYSTDMHCQLLDVNIKALVEFTLEAIRTWRTLEVTGTVLNVSSVAGELPFPLFATYAASKAFVTRFGESLDFETVPYGIRVLTSSPGVVATQFRARAGGGAETSTGGIGRPISSECAARAIWQQIQRGQRVRAFDWRYRTLLKIAQWLPRSWLAVLNKRAIQRFHPHAKIVEIPQK